jgi:hypothetical protein
MGIMDFLGGRQVGDDMAGAKARPLDAAKIEGYVSQLKRVVYDRPAFDAVFQSLIADKAVSASEMIEIARAFAHGVKVKAKKDAILAIGQERMRLSHAKSKSESATKAKGW